MYPKLPLTPGPHVGPKVTSGTHPWQGRRGRFTGQIHALPSRRTGCEQTIAGLDAAAAATPPRDGVHQSVAERPVGRPPPHFLPACCSTPSSTLEPLETDESGVVVDIASPVD